MKETEVLTIKPAGRPAVGKGGFKLKWRTTKDGIEATYRRIFAEQTLEL
jgi:hypothetical protein